MKKLSKKRSLINTKKKGYNEYKLQYNKQSIEENLIQRSVKKTIQIRYDKSFFDRFPKVLNDFLFVERRELHLEKVNDVVQ